MSSHQPSPFTFIYRLREAQWLPEAAIERTLRLFEKNARMLGEVMLFFPDGTLPGRESGEAVDETLRLRMQQIRAAGASAVGIDASAFGICADLFTTRGSCLEKQGSLLSPMISHRGETPKRIARPCPLGPGFDAFQRDRMAALARTAPDFIYLEDELRLAHHGGGYYCFCEHCLARFQDGKWSREALVGALDSVEVLGLREAWVEFVSERLALVVQYAREGMTRFTNTSGGRVAVIGYHP